MVERLKNYPKIQIPNKVYSMSSSIQKILKTSLDALVKKDANLARTVLAMDDNIDAIHNSMFNFVEEQSKRDQEMMGQWFYVLSISRYLERVADYATNISEDVMYMAGGEITRHSSTS